MAWLFVVLISYLILAITALVDKYLLSGPITDPKVYAFYVGILGVIVLILIPFVGFQVPSGQQILLSIFAGASGVYAIFWFYRALSKFEASRVVPAVGAITPIFAMALTYIFSGGGEILSGRDFFAFLLLISGSVLIAYEKGKTSLEGLPVSTFAALFLALSLLLIKYVYLGQPFWSGLIWMRFGGILASLIFLFRAETRKEIIRRFKKFFESKKKAVKERQAAFLFLSNQALAALAGLLREWAIFLAPLAYIAIINALSGVQHVFLLLLALLISYKFPKILKEKISAAIVFNKITAIFLIIFGLMILTFP